MKTWKIAEKKIAQIFDGERVGVTGRPTPDVLSERFLIEVKTRVNCPKSIQGLKQNEYFEFINAIPLCGLYVKQFLSLMAGIELYLTKKTTKLPKFLMDAYQSADLKNLSDDGVRVPLVVFHWAGKRYENSLVVVDSAIFSWRQQGGYYVCSTKRSG